MGAIGGSVFHGIAGFRNAPKLVSTSNLLAQIFSIYIQCSLFITHFVVTWILIHAHVVTPKK